jgi:large subunit ribosomal protein L24
MKIRKGDTVLVISGKDRGRKGKVRLSFPKEGKLAVEGINIVKKHARPIQGARQAGIIQTEAPIYISKLMLICPRCGKPTRVGHKVLPDKKVRLCRKCGEVID